jgi:serine/threonine-protein kinase
MPFCVGQLLRSRYQILGELSQITQQNKGGFGTIYLALDTRKNRVVVIKESSAADSEVQNALLEEIKLLTTIRHDHLPRIFDYFLSHEQRLCMVMEYIIGKSLQSFYVEERRPSVAMTAGWISQVLDALTTLHRHTPPIVHCDVKLDNIQIHSGTSQAYLLDFGIATSDHSAQMGTPLFAAPEQFEQSRLTPAADVYAVGVCLYMLLTGQAPRDDVPHSQPEIIAPRTLNAAIPPALERIILRALALDPSQRYANAQSMLEALRVVSLPEQSSGVRPPSAARRRRRGRQRRAAETSSAPLPRQRQPPARPADRVTSTPQLTESPTTPVEAAPLDGLAQPTESRTPTPVLIIWDNRYFWIGGYLLLGLISCALLVIPSALIAPATKYGTLVCGSYPMLAVVLVAMSHMRQQGISFEKRHLFWVAIFVMYSVLIEIASIVFSDPHSLIRHPTSSFTTSMLLMIAQGVVVGASVACCQRSARLEQKLEME